MSPRLLATALSVTLLACSGSSAQVDAFDPPPATFVTEEPDSSSPKPSTPADSGLEQDAGLEASADATADVEKDASPVARYGLAFTDVAGERVVADLPASYIVGGHTQATWEGWFKHDGFPANTQELNGRLFQHGASTVICKVVTPDPVATEAGKVECELMQEKSIRSTIKVSGAGWFHLALTYDAGTFRMHLNGSPQGTATVTSTQLPAEATSPFDASPMGKTLFGSLNLDKYSSTTTVDEYRLSSSALYGSAAFAPPKHLTSTGSDLLLMLDDGSGTTSDSGKARVHDASWVAVSR